MLLLASPAAAGIHRYTDSRGIIHITNSPPPQARNLQEVAPASIPEPQAAPPVSKPMAAAAPAAQLLTPAQVEALLLPENSEATAPRTATSPRSTASDSWQQPLQKAAGEMAGAIPAAMQEVLTAGPPKAPTVAAESVQRYRDAVGIRHITNQSPTAAEPAPAFLAAHRRRPAAEATSAAPSGRPESQASALPWRPASFSPGTPALAARRTTYTPSRMAALEEGNHIRRYRDRHGVIHISNVSPEETPPPLERERLPVLAHLATGKGRPPPSRSQSLELWAAAHFKPAAWSGEGILPLTKARQEASLSRDESTTEGGIRRWRDKHGVWHIKTVEYPWPAGVPVPPRLAGLIPGTSPPEAPWLGTPSPRTVLKPPPGTAPAAATSRRPPLTTITAFRDRHGRLEIINATPGAGPGRAPPPRVTIAPAQLEPLIVEAAQVYRLPPSLVKAVIKEESDFCAWAVSPKGALGLMQLMPGTADFLGVREPFNPRENILGGCRYLRLLLDFFGGSVPLALAGYNAGYQRVVSNGFQVPPIKETQNFVTRVMERYIATEKRLGLPWT